MFTFRGYNIPVDLVHMTGAGPDNFGAISDAHILILQDVVGIKEDHSILEIGCGIGRDAIPLASIISNKGSYTGIDIIDRSILWCKENISKNNSNFDFYHFDVEDQLHNPQGAHKTTEFTLPIKDNSTDRIILWSVFTHMFENDIVHYLKEFRRVLKEDGTVWATVFVVNDEVIASAQRTNLTPYDLRFEQSYGDGCFVNDIVHPAGAVAFSEDKIMCMITEAGLELAQPIIFGSWSGHYPPARMDPGQDGLVLRRSARS